MLITPDRSQFLIIDVQDRLAAAIPEREQIVRNCAVLLKAANELGVPVMASEQYPQGLGHTVAELSALTKPEDRLEKVEFSCVQNERLADRLKRPGRDQIVIGGVEAHVCVLQTAFDALSRGSEVFVVADAVGSRHTTSKELALRRLEAGGASVVTTEMVVFEWLQSASAPAFKALSKLIR